MLTPKILHDRFYSSRRWKRRARLEKAKNPLCEDCLLEGKTTIAVVTHHVEDFAGNQLKFFTGPTRSLCRFHHELTHGRGNQKTFSKEIGIDGWPTSPNHPANNQGDLPSVHDAKLKAAKQRKRR